MSGLVKIPEIILLNTINSGLKFIRTNYADTEDKSKTYLSLLLGDTRIEKYKMFDQAVAVICNDEGSPRYLYIDLMFNSQRDNVPSIHITLPAESPSDGNGLGVDEDYNENLYEDNYDEDDAYVNTTVQPVFTRRIRANYNLVIVSDNSNEVVLLYHIVRALLIALASHLALNGLYNITFAGQDIQPYRETANQLYMRSVTLGLQYDTSVPMIHTRLLPNDIVPIGHPKETL